MGENRATAAFVLDTAKKAVTVDRGPEHGNAENSFRMIGQLWSVYVMNAIVMRHKLPAAQINIDEADVAQMMSLMKKARFVHGKQDNPDNFVDDVGYSSLAGMFVLPPVDPPEAPPRRPMDEAIDRKIDDLTQSSTVTQGGTITNGLHMKAVVIDKPTDDTLDPYLERERV